ncbi:MAG TPA: phosphatase PAP2 family protein [Candidatus Saccharimonadales bacterium]|nr:phosphatase PAP2 family protein [Candidatus Saccharimonadales bacterium]
MTQPLSRTRAAIARLYREHPAKFWLRVSVVALAVILFVIKRNFWTPDTLFIVLLVLAVAFGKARPFLVRFVPFIGLLLVYDSFRGIADDLNKSVHFTEMIVADRALFGGVLPTEWLQKLWWHGQVMWYDFYFYFLYTIHFVAPVLVALLIWWRRERLYWPYIAGFIFLSFGGFITYVLFPAAPPWMASDLGYIDPIHRISSDIWYAMGVTNFSEVYSRLSPNPVAAVPSLHAAYPTLMVLFMAHAFGWKRTAWLWLYPISIWVGIVYLGEHYVVDALLGALYAFLAYRAAIKIFNWKRSGGLDRLADESAREWGEAIGRSIRARFTHK